MKTKTITQITSAMTERELQQNIILLAEFLGWAVHAERPARNKNGWATPIQGNPGFPDLVLAKNGRVLFWELKTEKGILTDGQRVWLNTISRHTPEAAVIRPSAWLSGDVERILRGN